MPSMRTLDELIDKNEPAWPDVQRWVSEAKHHVEILPAADHKQRQEALHAIQVTTRSPMGAIVYESGGIFVDHGWLRILGGGCERLPRSLPGWNQSIWGTLTEIPYLLVADDALGGFFAIDAGEFGNPGNVFYLSPDTLRWEPLDLGYTDFLFFCFSGRLDEFYGPLRWPDWQAEVEKLNGDQGISVYPPPFATEHSDDTDNPDDWLPIANRKRSAVPIRELYKLYVEDLPQQLEGLPED